MNRKELVKRITNLMRENNISKPVSSPKQVFHISDDEGNTRNFIVRKTDKSVPYTTEDINAMMEACLYVITEALKKGESISIRGFGTLCLKYRKPRATKKPGTDEWVDVRGRYVPKFSFGNDLRMCARVYELSLQDNGLYNPLPMFNEEEAEDI